MLCSGIYLFLKKMLSLFFETLHVSKEELKRLLLVFCILDHQMHVLLFWRLAYKKVQVQ